MYCNQLIELIKKVTKLIFLIILKALFPVCVSSNAFRSLPGEPLEKSMS